MVETFNQPKTETHVLKHFVSREMTVEEVTIAGGSARTIETGTVLAVYTGGANLGKYVEAVTGGTDGAAVGKCVLLKAVDVPAAGDVVSTGAFRLGVVARAGLVFTGTPTDAQKAAILTPIEAAHLLVR